MIRAASVSGAELRKLRRARGLTQDALAKRAGVNRRRIIELELGLKSVLVMEYGNVIALAEALGVPVTVFGDAGTEDWDIVPWSDVRRIEEYLREMSEGQSMLIWTHGIDSYLVPDPFVVWSERSRLERLGWTREEITPRLAGWGKYVEKQREIRGQSSCLHRFIAPAGFLADAFQVEAGWAQLVRREFEAYDEESAVGLVGPAMWEDAVRELGKLIPWEGCDKICVGESLAMVRPTRELFCFTRRPRRIQQLRSALEAIAGAYVQYSFPRGDDLTPNAFKQSCEKAVNEVLTIARR